MGTAQENIHPFRTRRLERVDIFTSLFFSMCGCFAVCDGRYLVLVAFADRLPGDGFFRFNCLRLLRLVDAAVVVNA